MSLQTIEVIVSPQGETTVQTKGFSGSDCQDASRSLEKTLGSQLSERLTEEFYQQPTVPESLPQRGGA